jgi:hypothetical protein
MSPIVVGGRRDSHPLPHNLSLDIVYRQPGSRPVFGLERVRVRPRKPTIGDGGRISKQRVKASPWSDGIFTLSSIK